jgi:Mg2+/citrate symporter
MTNTLLLKDTVMPICIKKQHKRKTRQVITAKTTLTLLTEFLSTGIRGLDKVILLMTSIVFFSLLTDQPKLSLPKIFFPDI